MESKLSRWCEGLIEVGWLVALLATPLFFNIHSSRVFEPDKLTLLRSVAVLMAVAWLTRFVAQEGWRDVSWLRWRSPNSIWRMPFALLVVSLILVYFISTIFSVTPRVSWAGSYQRLQGTYTTLSYVVIFGLMLATLRRREQVQRAVTVVIVSSIPVALYGMLQHFGLDPLPWGGDVQRRIAGHMGNSIFIAAYLIMAVPLTAARIIDAFTNIMNDENLSYADVVRSSIYIFALAIQLAAIYWSGSRGPIIGLAVGMFAFVLIVLVGLRNAVAVGRPLRWAEAGRAVATVALGIVVPFVLLSLLFGALSSGGDSALAGPTGSFVAFVAAVGVLILAILVIAGARRGWGWLWLTWILLAVFMAGWLFLFNVPEATAEPYRDTPVVGETLETLAAWKELPAVGRLGRLLESEAGSGKVRVLIWQGALDLLQPHEPLAYPDGGQDPFNFLRPIIGYGPESMYVAYNRFYPPELATIEARNASPDRSHNETFDALIITGAAGFLVWQALYLSVFYYGFRWLGVVRSKRDRNLLVGFWVGGAVMGAAVITLMLDLRYIGVAIPFGSIGGLVAYLIYYALFAAQNVHNLPQVPNLREVRQSDPFNRERLLMIGLVTAVLAHYVEIHFGIAIAVTRVHFFVYVALMLLVGYLLPKVAEAGEPVVETAGRGRRRRGQTRLASAAPGGWAGPVWTAALLLALMIGILGYDYMNYALPPGKEIQTLEDIPTAGEIFHQALFVNPTKGFEESPYLYLMVIFTWMLGSAVFLSELAKAGVITFAETVAGRGTAGRRQATLGLLLGMAVAAVVYRVLGTEAAGPTRMVGNILLWLWAAVCALAAVLLHRNTARGRLAAGMVALVGLTLSLPVMVAGGGLEGFLLAAGCAAVLVLLWEKSWNRSLLPAAVVALASLAIGLFYAYFQASQIRTSIIGPQGLAEAITQPERRILEANLVIGMLSLFYMFVIGMMLITSVALAWGRMAQARPMGTTSALAVLAVLFAAGVFGIYRTNTRVVQADMVYKRADPFDKQAFRARNPADWDGAIALYEYAIDLAPQEDFYYLWLGRAYLEQSGVSPDEAQDALLQRANQRLVTAQQINPLNTDHTANLARLNTRWAELEQGDTRQDRIVTAEDYYQDALALSPNNAVIWNETARLTFALKRDCEGAAAIYDQSAAIDPFYPNTHFEKADIMTECAQDAADETQQTAYYEQAAASLQEGLGRNPRDPRRWVQLAQVHRELDNFDEAVAALAGARPYANEQVPEWNIDFTLAAFYEDEGNVEEARRLAEQALANAPEEAAESIRNLLDRLNAD